MHSDTPPNLLTGHLTELQKEKILQLKNILSNLENDHVMSSAIKNNIREKMDRYKHIAHRGISWNRFTSKDMIHIANGLGGQCLSSIVTNLCCHYYTWVGGVPDLMIWKTSDDGMEEGEVRFIEVKGPNDSLSETQKAWIHLLRTFEIDVMVVHVEL